MSAIHWVTGYFRRSLFQEELRRESLSFFLVLGPISMIAMLCIALQQKSNLDLAFASAVCLYLCFSMKTRGFFYALLILFCSAVCKHTFFLSEHLWQIGIECSSALSFFISALAAELIDSQESSILSEMKTQSGQIARLNEKIFCFNEERAALEEQATVLKNEQNELQSQIASLEILNEVLRQSSAKGAMADEQIAVKERRIAELLDEIAERNRSSNQEEWEDERRNLLNELDLARSEKEQSYLINETLVRMHAAADKRAKEQQKLLEETLFEKEKLVKKLSEKERALPLFEELADEKTLRDLNELRALHAQLREQFEQKNALLHQTRRELFRTDTYLQAEKIEEKQKKEESCPYESLVCEELIQLAEENSYLEEENRTLLDLASALIHSKE